MIMSDQSFIKEVENCLQAMNAAESRRLILRWAREMDGFLAEAADGC